MPTQSLCHVPLFATPCAIAPRLFCPWVYVCVYIYVLCLSIFSSSCFSFKQISKFNTHLWTVYKGMAVLISMYFPTLHLLVIGCMPSDFLVQWFSTFIFQFLSFDCYTQGWMPHTKISSSVCPLSIFNHKCEYQAGEQMLFTKSGDHTPLTTHPVVCTIDPSHFPHYLFFTSFPLPPCIWVISNPSTSLQGSEQRLPSSRNR